MSTKVLHRSLSSIHILYNQALVGGLSDSFDPATRIANFQLPGGSTVFLIRYMYMYVVLPYILRLDALDTGRPAHARNCDLCEDSRARTEPQPRARQPAAARFPFSASRLAVTTVSSFEHIVYHGWICAPVSCVSGDQEQAAGDARSSDKYRR